MDTLPFVYPHVLGESHIQPTEPDALASMLQSGNDSSAVFFYSCNKNRSNREDRAVDPRAVYQRIKGLGKYNFQLDQQRSENSRIFDDDWL